MKAKVKSGTITKKLSISNSQTKEVLHEEEKNERVRPVKVKDGEAVAIVKFTSGLKRTSNYQSVMVEVGVEMPFSVRPGDTKALSKHFETVETIVEDRLAEQVEGVTEVLKELSMSSVEGRHRDGGRRG